MDFSPNQLAIYDYRYMYFNCHRINFINITSEACCWSYWKIGSLLFEKHAYSVLQVMSALHSGICFCCFDNLLCILTLHVGAQFKILQNRLETIFGNFSEEKSLETYEEFKKCIMNHHFLITYVEKLECVFCFPLMFQLLMSSIVLCLSGFQLTMVSYGMFSYSHMLIFCFLKLFFP